ncbi:MAG: CHASE2 domain-containing protein [Limnochordia bacterium]|jgi:adenylate cyclase
MFQRYLLKIRENKPTFYIFFIIAVLFLMGAFEGLELTTLNYRFTARYRWGEVVSEAPVAVIVIDEKSLAALGQWPWARDVHADLLERLDSAAVVGFDIIFNEPAPWFAEDWALYVASRERNVVLPAVFEGGVTRHFGESVWTGKITGPAGPLARIPTGHITVLPDSDGILRRIPVELGETPAFALRVAQLFGKEELPFEESEILINYRGGPGRYPWPVYSYIDVLEGQIPADFFRGRAVIVGATARGSAYDLHLTPITSVGAMPGIFIQANLLASILTDDYVHRASSFISLLCLLAGTLFCSLALGGRPRRDLMIYLGTNALFLFFNLFVFFRFSLWMDYVPVVLLLTANLGSSFYRSYKGILDERRRWRDIFSRYLPPPILERVINSLEGVQLGGERLQITVLFADMRGFTKMTEGMAPEDVVQILNQYLGVMSNAVAKHGGILDKYTGDGVMAVFGAPVSRGDHVAQAVATAIDIQRRVKILPQPSGLRGVGIGIATGEAVAGHIGSWWRMDYTVIGNPVNRASHLEKLAEAGQILICDETAQRLPEEYVIEALPGSPGDRKKIWLLVIKDTEAAVSKGILG